MVVPALVLAAFLSAQPDVFVLSVDTLRADYLGCYGFAYPTSPHIDRLAKQSRVYDDVVCDVPLTAPSMAAMFSGRYPRRTGLTRNGMGLPGDVPAVAQSFQDAGYDTVAVISNWTLKGDLSGLDRGFALYDDDFKKGRWGPVIGERDGKIVSDRALGQLRDRDPDTPLFAWFHWSDPHAPYQMRKNHNVAREFQRDTGKTGSTRREYASEVAYTDHQIGRVLEMLPTENAYVVFLADHGESLYEHDYLGHGRHVYRPGLRIPLMIRGPGIEPGRTDAPGRGVDLAPTLSRLAGLDPLPDTDGINLLRLKPQSERVRVVEGYGGAVVKLPGLRQLMASRGPVLQGVVHKGWKYILDGHREELYRLDTDPEERRNVAGRHPERAEALRAHIRTWNDTVEEGEVHRPELSEDDIEALESLGYIE